MSIGTRCLEWTLEVGLHQRRPGRVTPLAPEKVRRILVVRKDNIGDVLCTTPALRAVRKAFPDAHLAILVTDRCRGAVARNPDLDEVLTYDKPKHRPGVGGLPALASLTRLIQTLRRRRFDLAIGMGRPCGRSTAWLAYATGARWRLGYRTSALSPFPFFLNLGDIPSSAVAHEVDVCLDLVAQIGIPPAGRCLTLVPDPSVVQTVRRRLEAAGTGPGDRLAMVHISSRQPINRWPLTSFARLADALKERLGLRVVVTWAPGDARNPHFPGDDLRVEEMVRHMRIPPILLQTPTLDEFVAGLSLCGFLLSADGGPTHMAAALGVPQVALFGRPWMAYWGPVSERSIVLQRGNHVQELDADEVFAAAAKIVSRWGSVRTAEGAAV
jgi:ADP-heptose:LPS heptosyltransferase